MIPDMNPVLRRGIIFRKGECFKRKGFCHGNSGIGNDNRLSKNKEKITVLMFVFSRHIS
jgi:hypothetical protein